MPTFVSFARSETNAASSPTEQGRHRQTRLLRAVQALGCSLDDCGSESKGKHKGIQKAGEWENVKTKGKGKENVEAHELELDYPVRPTFRPFSNLFDRDILRALHRGIPSLCWRARAGAAGVAYLDRAQKQKRFITLPASQIPAHGLTRVIYPTVATRAQWARKIAVLIADPATGLQMRDAKSRSGGVGMHTKRKTWAAALYLPRARRVGFVTDVLHPQMILGTLRCALAQDDDTKNETESEGESDAAGRPLRRPHAWFYVGSHNFSVVNYELGVVRRPEDADAAVVWERPTRKYIEGTSRGSRWTAISSSRQTHIPYYDGFLDGIQCALQVE
ncbi:hypothetical protein B0H11DRAFT_2289070 [Mycena galericulata]|nr:hypothetical protein B0H11DRAFT_2289070 [Mycena galericulata]